MQTIAIPVRPSAAPQFVKIREVPLNYTGHESTLVIKNGYGEFRVMIEVGITGGDLRDFCEATKGWDLAEHGLRVTVADPNAPLGRRIIRYAPEKVERARILPTTIEVEWPMAAPEKG